MNKNLIIFGIVVLLICIELSGCTSEDEITTPTISSFTVEPNIINYGETANLVWIVENADTVSIDNGIGIVSLERTRIIQPAYVTTYTLTASKSGNKVTASTYIMINTSSIIIPSIQFTQDKILNTLIVAQATPSNILWSVIEIIGDCDISRLGTHVLAGDIITDCSGTISMRHIPTNTLIGTWIFP